jgi:hypothetical protein
VFIQVTGQGDRFLLFNKTLETSGGAVLLPEDIGLGAGDVDDDAQSVASSCSSVASLASELAGPSTSKATKLKDGQKKDGKKNTADKKKGDKRKKKTAGVPRIICFASNFGLSLLRKADCWSSDGTFSVCPEPFFQFYSVHAHLGQQSYPSAFIFMPGKKRLHYHVSLVVYVCL